jgi:hypothetical protein
MSALVETGHVCDWLEFTDRWLVRFSRTRLDIPISIIMAGFTYLTAGWSMHVMVERHWHES